MTRKVVDANFLQDDNLRDYLEERDSNHVVLTDYAAMEAYKGDTLLGIFKSMEILSAYPKQVIVLKGTKQVCGLKASSRGLAKRLIDHSQTSTFARYCVDLKKAKNGDAKIQATLLEYGKEANHHMDLVLNDARNLANSIQGIADTFTKEELAVLRKRKSFTKASLEKLQKSILLIAGFMFRDHPNVTVWPDATSLPNTFIFRYSLCTYLLATWWISEGGAEGAAAARLRNDLVDMSYVAYSTYFDGFLSKDKKANEIYFIAKYMLATLFQYDKRVG